MLLAGQEYSYLEWRERIQSLGADVRVAIVDSCSSGALTRSKGGGRRPAFLTDQTASMEGHAFLTSSSASEAAQESDRLGASFFTHYLVSGLRGAADSSGDGLVTLDEAYQHAFSATLASTERTQFGPQHPSYDINLNGSGQLVLTDLRQTNARLVAGADVVGTVFVRDTSGALVAELRNSSGQVSTLGLAAGAYRITLERDGEVLAGDVAVVAGSTTHLEPGAMRRIRRELTVARGDIEPPPPPSYQPLRFGLLPDISFGPASWLWPNSSEVHAVNINLLISSSAGIRGADVAGVMTIAHGPISGAQTAGVVAIAAESLLGFQAAGVLAVARDSVAGGQTSGVLSWATGDVAGLQASGVYSHAVGGVRGAQASTVNYAGGIAGAQLGVVNIAKLVRGIQLGVVNVAAHATGVQLGVVNVAESFRGFPIGLVSIATDGVRNVDYWNGSDGFHRLAFRVGTWVTYTMFSGGYLPAESDGGPEGAAELWSVGVGGGIHLPLGFLSANVDASLRRVQATSNDWLAQEGSQVLGEARAVLSAGWDRFGAFAGVQLQAYVPEWTDDQHLGAPGPFHIAPGFIAGLYL